MQTHNAEYVDVRIINGEDAAMLKSLVPEEQCTIVVDDVEQLVLAAEKDLNTSHSNAAEWFDEYHTYEEIIGWYEDIASDYERITKYVPRVGLSYGGLDMPVSVAPCFQVLSSSSGWCHWWWSVTRGMGGAKSVSTMGF